MVTAWMTFIKERFPLSVYLALSLGISVSSFILAAALFSQGRIIISTMGIMLFFFTLRLMDEYKDYQKDLLAYPTRPLPRGLITRKAAADAIYRLMLIMMAFAGAVGAFYGMTAFILYMLITGYLYLMFREFFIGNTLSSYPLLYALTHQIILFPLIFFSIALFDPSLVVSKSSIFFAAAVFFAFFTYEICRKLDPNAPLILGTYWRISGGLRTTLCLIVFLIAGMASSFNLFNQWHFLPFSFLVLLTLILFIIRPRLFKWVEMAASISLMVHIWSVGLWRLIS